LEACSRSNKGASGVDRQDFADIGCNANGKLRPLGISTLRDLVCMTAAMLVLEPIFEADLPPEQDA
jgi:RNA-directed DNA polymerase